ncbi:MAG: hypothetical protein PVSMB1_13150 [Gemmatimonadaceae bacterium]
MAIPLIERLLDEAVANQAAAGVVALAADEGGVFYQGALFEPNEGWEYGVGIAWVGKIVEAVIACSLEGYLQDNVFAPLGIKGHRLRPARRHEAPARRANAARTRRHNRAYRFEGRAGRRLPHGRRSRTHLGLVAPLLGAGGGVVVPVQRGQPVP